MRTITTRLTDSDGKVYKWAIQRVPRAYNCGGNLPKPRIISGWQYTDHDGIPRMVEGNWGDLVAAFHLTAENYGFATKLS